MPFSGESTINLGQTLTEWSCHWQKFTGGKDGLKIDFKSADPAAYFKVRYIIEDNLGKLSLSTMTLDKNQQGQLVLPDFSKQNRSITIIPCLEMKNPTNVDEKDYTYYLSASTLNKTEPGDQDSGAIGNATSTGQEDSSTSTQIKLPFTLDKPVSQMSRQELLITIIKLILYLRGISI